MVFDMLPPVGIVDSGGPSATLVGARRFFSDEDGAVHMGPPHPDRLGHGTQVDAILRRGLPKLVPLHAQIFDDRPVTSPARVAAALDWLVGEGARVVCLSLGLPHDRAVLREAVERALGAGVLLVAAFPAQGGPCFPAAYPGVIAATGDARCAFDDITLLGTEAQPIFGAWCASPERAVSGAPPGPGGASIACARLTAHVAVLLRDGLGADPLNMTDALRARVLHRGREVRRAGV
ncbi:hypothetical protein [Rhodospirillum sp. A1_3_36]|uniref:subtilisin-like serine protease QhpE n=1 Tax=Rhodospirillum sp. A1_3_36 TaxID=3391666 RepID=UPI0039A5788C